MCDGSGSSGDELSGVISPAWSSQTPRRDQHPHINTNINTPIGEDFDKIKLTDFNYIHQQIKYQIIFAEIITFYFTRKDKIRSDEHLRIYNTGRWLVSFFHYKHN